MILSSFLAALGQLGDGRFLRVVLLGFTLALALLFAVYAGFVLLLDLLTPDALTLPWVGEVHFVHDLIGVGSLLLMIGLSVFLMVPVASAFTGLFIDDVAQAVEDRHYPGLPPAVRLSWADVLVDTVNFFGVLVAVNVVALVLYAFVGPLAPLMFWAVNGYLLGREYFQMAAMRRIGRAGARELRKRHAGTAWIAGVLMVAPLTVPLVNLFIPVLGAATFTHIFHRIMAAEARAPGPR
jgi:uncharacterized protein involved in cysteine biosynthesis